MIYRSSFPVQREGRAEVTRRIVADLHIDRLTIESAIGQDQHDVRGGDARNEMPADDPRFRSSGDGRYAPSRCRSF